MPLSFPPVQAPPQLLELLAHIDKLPPQTDIPAWLIAQLGQLSGVAQAQLQTDADPSEAGEAGTDAPPALQRRYHLTPKSPESPQSPQDATLVLQLCDASAFAPFEPWMPLLCAALGPLLKLQRSAQHFRDLFDNSPDPCWLIIEGVFVDCNRAAVTTLGYAQRADILQHPARLSPVLQPDGRPSLEKANEVIGRALEEGLIRFEWEHCRADGSPLPVEVTLARLYHQGKTALYCVWRDITARKQAEQQVYQLAFYDPLTGLPNRRLLQDRLQQNMAASGRSGKYRALLYIDLDHFKVLNDTQGHDMGDRMLVEAARRLTRCVREGDTVARMGGDEFVVLLQQLDEALESAVAQVEKIGAHIVDLLAQPYTLPSGLFQSSASVGVAMFVGQDMGADEILKRADVAMYQAKGAGRNKLRFYDPAIQARLSARSILQTQLRLALQHEELVLHFQPQVNAQGQCLGAEALLRWQHPERGLLGPLEFIPLAEETGLIVPLGQWVLAQACRLLQDWQSQSHLAGLQLAVNVSAQQFHQGDLAHEVRQLLQTYPAAAQRLKIEITESLLLDHIEPTIATMQDLQALGVDFALDDFGTGYSSLSYVKRLPIRQLKIDKSFVRDILSDPHDAAICRAVIAMGHSMGLEILAEGVEAPAQWQALTEHGCDSAQGYWFARPMALADFLRWMAQRKMA